MIKPSGTPRGTTLGLPEEFEGIKDHVAFYAQLMDTCYVDGELVKPQYGTFYGGWITSEITGPFKGEPGTEGW